MYPHEDVLRHVAERDVGKKSSADCDVMFQQSCSGQSIRAVRRAQDSVMFTGLREKLDFK